MNIYIVKCRSIETRKNAFLLFSIIILEKSKSKLSLTNFSGVNNTGLKKLHKESVAIAGQIIMFSGHTSRP